MQRSWESGTGGPGPEIEMTEAAFGVGQDPAWVVAPGSE